MFIKICGIKTLQEAQAAVEAGVDMLGFNFYPKSRRYLALKTCTDLVATISSRWPAVRLVGVFVNSSIADIQSALAVTGLHLAQLSGDEPAQALAVLGQYAFKALRPQDRAALQAALAQYPPRQSPPAFLVDANRPGEFGGTGATADWELARDLAGRVPILLAGGLTPENVRAAIEQVNPWGVDVASGVESAPGVKDIRKMQQFVRQARQ